jgi:hypothetical protein
MTSREISNKIKFLLTTKDFWVYTILVLLIVLHSYLIIKTFVFDDIGNIRAAVAGYGDIPFHLTQVTKFAFGSRFSLDEPLFTGENLRYSFLINLLSGLLLKITGWWHFSFHLPSLVFASTSTLLIFVIYKKLLRQSWLALLAFLIFCLGSGFGSIYQITKYNRDSANIGVSFTEYLVQKQASTISRWDAKYPEQNVNFGGPLSLVLLHQRSFFFGLFLFSISLFYLTRLKKHAHWDWLPIAIAYGLSPLAHLHSFIVLSIALGIYGLLLLSKKKVVLFKKLLLGIVAGLIIAGPQIIYLVWSGREINFVGGNSFMGFHWGWMTQPTIGSIQFAGDWSQNFGKNLWAVIKYNWINFGLLLPVFLLSLGWVKNKGYRQIYPVGFFALAGLILFTIAQLIRFQPWDYDNNKIFVYYQLFAAPVAVSFLNFWAKSITRRYLTIGILGSFLLISIHSGIIDLLPRAMVAINQMPIIFSKNAVDLANFVRLKVSPSDQILTTSTHLNPVDSLAGRPVLVGYPGWLWTKGLSYSERENEIRKIYRDPDNNNVAIEKYKIKYVLLDPTATYDWQASRQKFDNIFIRTFRSGPYILYRIP